VYSVYTNENNSSKAAFVGHVMRRNGVENLVVSGKAEGRRRQTEIDSLCASWRDKSEPSAAHQGHRRQIAPTSDGRQRC